MKKLILPLLILACTLTACSKDDATDSKEELLSKSSWKLKALGIESNGVFVPFSNDMLPVEECKADNIYTFKADFTGIASEGATKCQSGDIDQSEFTWSISEDKKTLNLNTDLFGYVDGDNITILELTGSKLILTKKMTISGIETGFAVELQH